MIIEQFDYLLLKDGREASIPEVLSQTDFIVEVGNSLETWETIDITIDMIEKKLN